MALFEVWQSGRCIMTTEYPSCLYPQQTLLSMKEAGLTFRYNGKPYTPRGKLRTEKREY